jgi:peptidoglycan/xylan/chitin deacetylase (PgdA/CDA1 family)
MYHRFSADTKVLVWQCEHIRKYYQPLTLSSFVEKLRSSDSFPTNSLVITVDDGYRDFLLYGYPVFRHFDIPCTVYLVSDFLDGELWLWWNQMEFAFRNSDRTSLTFELAGQEVAVTFQSVEQRVDTGRRIADAMTEIDDKERLRLLKLIPELLEVAIPNTAPAEWAPLQWNEVRELARNGVDFGAHTRSHPVLSRINDPDKQRQEIEGSKLRIEQELGKPVRHFCYPNGRISDFNDESVAIVKSSGFETATTTERGLNFAGSQPFLLRRLGVEPTIPSHYFAELLAGARKE